MATKKYKCANCGSLVDVNEATVIASKRYCLSCAQTHQKEAQAYKDLIAFICDLFQIKAPSTLICTQLKRYKENEHYTYQGMQAALDYFFNLQGHSIEGSLGIGIIPYIYDEVKDFYQERKMIQAQSQGVDLGENANIRVINITQEPEQDYADFNLIDIGEIGGEDD